MQHLLTKCNENDKINRAGFHNFIITSRVSISNYLSSASISLELKYSYTLCENIFMDGVYFFYGRCLFFFCFSTKNIKGTSVPKPAPFSPAALSLAASSSRWVIGARGIPGPLSSPEQAAADAAAIAADRMLVRSITSCKKWEVQKEYSLNVYP